MSSTVRTRLQELTAPASGDVTMPVDFSRRRIMIRRPAVIVIAALALVVIAAAGMTASKVTQPEAAIVPEPSVALIAPGGAEDPTDTSAPAAVTTSVVVSVVGLVKTPGVVTLPPGSRVTDAIDAAGGFSTKANPASVNLARPVSDGEQIVVTDQAEPAANTHPHSPEAAPDGSGSGRDAAGGAPGAAGGGKINVNTASETELETLPGIGPATAAAIVTFRQDNGRFTSVEQLAEVPGIGPKKLERIASSVTV